MNRNKELKEDILGISLLSLCLGTIYFGLLLLVKLILLLV